MSIVELHEELLRRKKKDKGINAFRLPTRDVPEKRMGLFFEQYRDSIEDANYFYCEMANSTPMEYHDETKDEFKRLVTKTMEINLVYDDDNLFKMARMAVGTVVKVINYKSFRPHGVVVDACVWEDFLFVKHKVLSVIVAMFKDKLGYDSDEIEFNYGLVAGKVACPICGNVSYEYDNSHPSCKCKSNLQYGEQYEKIDIMRLSNIWAENRWGGK